MIRFLKQRLAIAERANGDGQWVRHLPGVLRDFNNSKIKGTDVKRSSVNHTNYLDLLGKLRHTSEPSLLFNMTEAFNAPSGLARFLWRYSLGDKVLLARRVDYAIKNRSYFEKPSVSGTFGPRVYTVVACRTKLNAEYFLCPIYGISSPGTGRLSGYFYESELSPALFDQVRPVKQQQQQPQTPPVAAAAAAITAHKPKRRRRTT